MNVQAAEGKRHDRVALPNRILLTLLLNWIMNEKLILTVEKSVVRRAKEYAENTGTSLSVLVEN
jgi:hypothetical protein